MAEKHATEPSEAKPASLLAHGGHELSSVLVDTYNAELRTTDGFVGDRASKRAFQSILDDWRDRMEEMGEDPFGEVGSVMTIGTGLGNAHFTNREQVERQSGS